MATGYESAPLHSTAGGGRNRDLIMSAPAPINEEKPHFSDGIYVLRTTQQNQVQLNLMADQKANIVIGMSLIFFTIAHQVLTGDKATPEWVILPLLLLSLTMTGSFLLSVLVLIPKIGKVKKSETRALFNPLFFGAFSSVEVDDFSDYLLAELQSPERARELLLRDIHSTGVALRRKFVLLRLAYLCLTVGVVVTIAAFLLLRSA